MLGVSSMYIGASESAFIAGAIGGFAGILVAIFVVNRRDLEQEVPEVEPAFEQAA